MKLLYGSQNFGYDTPQSDKDWLEFVYPTWQDIVSNNMISKEKKNEDGSVTKVKDIRLIIKMIEKANFNDLQFLYSQEMYECNDLQWFFDNRDRLVRCNLRQLFYSNKGYILSCLKLGTQKDIVRALCFTSMIIKAFNVNEFVMIMPELGQVREKDEGLDRCKDFIMEKLIKYENYVMGSDCERDEEILEQGRLEIERLLKAKLID